MRIFWLVVLFAFGCAWADDRADAPSSSAHESSPRISFSLVRDFAVLVHPSITGFRQLNFIIDTGSNRTIVDQHIADRLKLRGTNARLTSVNRPMLLKEGIIPEIRLGIRQFDSVRVLISDLRPLRESFGTRIDGILGNDILGNQTVSVDYSARTLTLGECGAAGFHAPLEISTNLPLVVAQIGDRQVRFLVDTGASVVQMYANDETAALTGSTRTAVGVAGQMRVFESVLPDGKLGDYHLANTRAFVVAEPPDGLSDFGGLLSPVALGFTHICLDFPKREFSWAAVIEGDSN